MTTGNDDNGKLLRLVEQIDKNLDRCDKKVDQLVTDTGEIKVTVGQHEERFKRLFDNDKRHDARIKAVEDKPASTSDTKAVRFYGKLFSVIVIVLGLIGATIYAWKG